MDVKQTLEEPRDDMGFRQGPSCEQYWIGGICVRGAQCLKSHKWLGWATMKSEAYVTAKQARALP